MQISWDEIMECVKDVSHIIPKHSTIWGIPRNGMLIACLIAHQRPDLQLVCVPFKETVIIDDIHDSGKTLGSYIRKGHKVITLYWRKKELEEKPFKWAKTIDHDSWLKFPWEK